MQYGPRLNRIDRSKNDAPIDWTHRLIAGRYNSPWGQ